MANSTHSGTIPSKHVALEGSELRHSSATKYLGPADAGEKIRLTIVLRRRPDGQPMPTFDYYAKVPPNKRRRLSQDEFAARHGASPGDIEKVVKFCESHGLAVVQTHAARRTVAVTGTVAQMNETFAVKLGRYQRTIVDKPGKPPKTETYRSRDGSVHVPKDLAPVILGVFGLDNRRISKTNGTQNYPPQCSQLSVNQITSALMYNFPTAGTNINETQWIAIFSASGYFAADIRTYLSDPSFTAQDINVTATNSSWSGNTLGVTNAGVTSITLQNAPPAEFGNGEGWAASIASLDMLPIGVESVNGNQVVFSSPLPQLSDNTTFYFYLDLETTADIEIAASAAPGANIAVYFNTGDELGWIDAINRVIHPDLSLPVPDPICSVLSTSYSLNFNLFGVGGDDAGSNAYVASVISRIDDILQDAARQGVTVCTSSGDSGCFFGKGTTAYVGYPASDPWALSVGGTSIGVPKNSPPPWVEYVWNDPNGATGGGVSAFFQVPSYQSWNQVNQVSINDNISTGRCVPDVAANASLQSGYPIVVGGIFLPFGGTSAATPLWAGLIAVLNSRLKYNLGFINPMLYQIGASPDNSQIFNPINFQTFNPNNPLYPIPNTILGGCPADNGWYKSASTAPAGYLAGPGWDACTGWGSPNGTALLNAFNGLLQQDAYDCYFIVDISTFDKVAVQTGVTVYNNAFFLVFDGFKPSDLGITPAAVNDPTIILQKFLPVLTGQLSGISIELASVTPSEPSLLSSDATQRFSYGYNVVFSDTSAFTGSGETPMIITATTTVAVSSTTTLIMHPSTTMELNSEQAPFFAGGSTTSWLSADLRVFQVQPGYWILPELPYPPYNTLIEFGNTGNPSIDATAFIQNVIQNFNAGTSTGFYDPNPGGTKPSLFDLLPQSESGSALDTLPIDPTNGNNPVYNFAIARVRYNAATVNAENVRVFFRIIPALSTTTAYDQNATYRQCSDGVEFGNKISLWGPDSTSPGEVCSIPCFANPRVDASLFSLVTQSDNYSNVQTIPATGSEVSAYFGCWLDINQPNSPAYSGNPGANLDGPFTDPSQLPLESVFSLIGNSHQCLVAEISYDPNPIQTGYSPTFTGPLAQRNLTLQSGANPGKVGSRRIPNTFIVKPTSVALEKGMMVDELMIDWGNTPPGSIANIYWPEASAVDLLQLAAMMYGTHNMTMADEHTIQMPAGGITYVPIPRGPGAAYPGLITVDLPAGIKDGQIFNIVVRQLTNSSLKEQKDRAGKTLNSRRITGAFQIGIQVKTKAVMLAHEERSLSILRSIQKKSTKGGVWKAVFERYLSQIAERVKGLGGKPDDILPLPDRSSKSTR